MPKLLIIGSSRPESLEMSYARAFEELGSEVLTWDPSAARAASSRAGPLGRLFSSAVQVEPWTRKANVELIQIASRTRPDAAIVIDTEALRGGSLAHLRALLPRIKIYALYPDSAHSVDPQRLMVLAACDRVGVSAPSWVSTYRKLGLQEIAYLPFAADIRLYQRASLRQQPPWEVGFVGTWRAEREDLLEAMSGFKTRVWGNEYWRTRTRRNGAVRGMWAGEELIGSRFSEACGDTAIMLNIVDPITWPGPNMRSFELPACGAFALSSRSEAILEIFKEGQTIECFESPEEAREKATYYLARPRERARIAEASNEFVTCRGHTYHDRARTVLEWLDRDRRS